jgi:mRNA interferase YafQ
MLTIITTSQFRKDVKLQKKRGGDIEKLEMVLNKIVSGELLEEKHHVHKLTGSFKGRLECHVTPDWLLIYRVTETALFLERTGSHSNLF